MKVTCLREPRRPPSSFQAEEQFSVLSNGDIGRQCKSCFCLTLRLPLVCFIFWQNRFVFVSDQVSFSLPPTFYSSKLTVRMRYIFRMSSHLRSYAYYLHYCPVARIILMSNEISSPLLYIFLSSYLGRYFIIKL